MYKYRYQAISSVTGKNVTGKVSAEDDSDFLKIVKVMGLMCYSYKAIGQKNMTRFKKLTIEEVVAFCRQLSSMLVAGLPLAKSLEMLYERTEKKKKAMRNVLAYLFEQVQKGESLASAMNLMGKTFPTLLISMVKSGEMSGQIDETLVKMAEHFEKEKKQKHQLKSALSYPKMLILVCLLVVSVLLVAVLPKMLAMLPEGEPIPGPTALLLKIKDIITQKYVLLACLIVGFIVLKKIAMRFRKVRIFMGKMQTKLPIVGKLKRMIYTANFARSLATLYGSGVSLLDSMQMSGEIMGNEYIEDQIQQAITSIRRGNNIAESLSQVEAFDPLLMTMIFVGEESGSLEGILDQTAGYFDEEADSAIKQLMQMISPVMLIVMAVVVGVVLIAIMMPMFAVYGAAGGGAI